MLECLRHIEATYSECPLDAGIFRPGGSELKQQSWEDDDVSAFILIFRELFCSPRGQERTGQIHVSLNRNCPRPGVRYVPGRSLVEIRHVRFGQGSTAGDHFSASRCRRGSHGGSDRPPQRGGAARGGCPAHPRDSAADIDDAGERCLADRARSGRRRELKSVGQDRTGRRLAERQAAGGPTRRVQIGFPLVEANSVCPSCVAAAARREVDHRSHTCGVLAGPGNRAST